MFTGSLNRRPIYPLLKFHAACHKNSGAALAAEDRHKKYTQHGYFTVCLHMSNNEGQIGMELDSTHKIHR